MPILLYCVINVETPTPEKKTYTAVVLQGAPCPMEIDSRATFILISEDTYNSLWPRNCPPIVLCNAKAVDYNKQTIVLKGAGPRSPLPNNCRGSESKVTRERMIEAIGHQVNRSAQAHNGYFTK